MIIATYLIWFGATILGWAVGMLHRAIERFRLEVELFSIWQGFVSPPPVSGAEQATAKAGLYCRLTDLTACLLFGYFLWQFWESAWRWIFVAMLALECIVDVGLIFIEWVWFGDDLENETP